MFTVPVYKKRKVDTKKTKQTNEGPSADAIAAYMEKVNPSTSNQHLINLNNIEQTLILEPKAAPKQIKKRPPPDLGKRVRNKRKSLCINNKRT